MYKYIAVLLVFLGISHSTMAQRVSYPQLVNRSEISQIFINDMVIPNSDSSSTLMFSFRFNYDFIPFRRVQVSEISQAPENAEYYSTLRFSAEVFEGTIKKRNSPATNTAGRDTWTDTLFVENFEATQTNKQYASGALTATLEQGTYNYVLQLSMLQEINERSTQRREIKVPALSGKDKGEIYLVRSVNETPTGTEFLLMNMEDNIEFGKDFTALVRLPKYDPDKNYSVEVRKASEDRNSDPVYENEISNELFFTNSSLSIHKDTDPALILNESGTFTYAVIPIPSSQFDNSSYTLTLNDTKTDSAVAERKFQTYWQDMPASLYNLDIAINMLKFILPEDEVEQLGRGSDKQKEQKFREFWDSRDPTPNTVFNELMAEYYRRIDHAFKEFGSQQEPMGHESDRGEIYIKFGPPNSKERVFPPGGKTRETWKYPNQTFVFEAVSGFGDFKLIGKQ